MDMQRMLDAMMDACRSTRSQYHLTLGELIDTLEGLLSDCLVMFDKSHGYPDAESLHSYRGYYSDLAIGRTADKVYCYQLLPVLKEALNATYEGYKGGDFVMGVDAPLWLSNPGFANETAIVGTSYIGNGRPLLLITKQLD